MALLIRLENAPRNRLEAKTMHPPCAVSVMEVCRSDECWYASVISLSMLHTSIGSALSRPSSMFCRSLMLAMSSEL